MVDFVGVSPIMTPCMDISICALLNAEIHEKKSRGEVNTACGDVRAESTRSAIAIRTMGCLKFYRSTNVHRYESRAIVI